MILKTRPSEATAAKVRSRGGLWEGHTAIIETTRIGGWHIDQLRAKGELREQGGTLRGTP